MYTHICLCIKYCMYIIYWMNEIRDRVFFFLRMSMESATKIILNCSILNPHMTYKEWNFSSIFKIICICMYREKDIGTNMPVVNAKHIFLLPLSSSRILYGTYSAYMPCYFLYGLIYFYIWNMRRGNKMLLRAWKRTCINISYSSIEYNSYT